MQVDEYVALEAAKCPDVLNRYKHLTWPDNVAHSYVIRFTFAHNPDPRSPMATTRTVVITVNLYKDGAGGWWADSDDLFGLNVWEANKRELVAEIPRAIEELMEANGFAVSGITERAVLPKAMRTEAIPTKTAYIVEETTVATV